MDRLHAIARGTPLGDRREGSALFADVSGFTKLTELLVAQHGLRRGAEELTVRLNRVYGALIGEVDRFGGAVIGFSGDAITCWFDAGPAGEDHDLGRTARLATCCAAQMRARLVELGDAAGPGLGIKVAIASGPARRFVVGDPSIQLLDVVAGETLARMATCERLAAVSEVVVDERTLALAAPSSAPSAYEWREEDDHGARGAVLHAAPVVEEPPSWPALEPGALPDDVLRRWVLPGVNPEHGEFVTDIRQTVPMFLGFEGIDFDGDARAGEKLDAFVRWVQGVLARFDASLLDITVGDKGSYLYASFGAPAAHEDDAVRAATAALELRRPPTELAFVRTVRIGISQGTTRAGIVGGPTRRTYAALGDEVNLAARLMQRAEAGAVLVSGRIHDLLGDAFVSQELPAVQIKGKAALVPVHRLEAHRGGDRVARAPAGPLVGRTEEWGALEQSLERLLAGEGSVVVVEGEPGLGKSRLVQELRAHGRARGAAIFVGVGDPVGQATLFHGWRPIFRAIFEPPEGTVAGDAADDVLARVTQLTADTEAAAFAPLLAPVLPMRLPDSEATAGLTGQVRADRRLALMVDVLRGVAARTPTVLVLEDAHWLDTASWSLLQRVARQVEPLLLVCATRPPDTPAPEFSELVAEPSTKRLVLDPLETDDVVEIVRQRLGAETLPSEVATLITEKAEGNPFFCEELASALRDGGVITVVDGTCALAATPAQLRALDLPDTVQGVITSRIDRLTDAQKLAIKFASVIGRSFRLRTLEAIHPVPSYVPQLHDDLDVLAERHLTPLVSVEPELTFAFKHAITQEVAYNMLLFEQRVQLHRAIAGWFEQSLAENLAPYYATLAHHWRRAVDPEATDPEPVERALDYGMRAGEQALRNNAHVEAAEEFRQVIELLGSTAPTAERDHRELLAQTMLGYALMNQRGYGDADVEAAYTRARSLTGSSRASAEVGPALYGLLSYYASRGEYEPARQVADELLALGEELDDPQLRLIGHNSVGLVAVLRGELETGRVHTEQSYRLADEHQDQDFMLRYGGDFRGYPRAWLSTAECLLGYPDRALRVFEQTLELTRDHPYTFGFMLTFGITPILRADLQHTLACAEQLAEVSRRYGFALLQLVADIHRGWARALQGDADGVAQIAGALPVITFVKLDSFLPMYLGLQAEAQLATAQLADAAASLAEADAYLSAAGESFYAAELSRLQGSLHALRGEPADAATCLTRALAIARRQGARWWELRAAVALASLEQPPERREEAQASLSQLVESFDEGEATADVLAAQAALNPSVTPQPTPGEP